MSQIVAPDQSSGFVLIPFHLLPCQDIRQIADIVRTYEQAMDEARHATRPSVIELMYAYSTN